jgi:RNA polymerase sigma factor (sigma-70 family)
VCVSMDTEPDQMKPDRRAQFEALVAECETPLLRYVSRILNSSDTAQDVVQDTLIRCYRSWDGCLVPSTPLMSWLYRVAHNRAIDVLRQSNRREAVHEAHSREMIEVEESRQSSKGVSEAAERASDALQKLSLREQQVVILKVYEERSYREISNLLGISVSNVGYILHYAMKKLAEALKEDPTP